MELSLCKKRNIFNWLEENTKKFFFSFCYPVFLAIVVNLFWFFGEGLYAGLFFCLMGGYIFAVFKNVAPLFVNLIFFVVSFNDLAFLSVPSTYFVLIPLFIGIAIHFIRFPVNFMKRGKLFFPILFVYLSLLLGGTFIYTGSSARFFAWFSYAFGIGAFWFVFYAMIYPMLEIEPDFKLDRYIAFSIIALSFAACTQLGNAFIVSIISGKRMVGVYGWGLSIQVATLILLALPSSFYLMVKTQKVITYCIISSLLFLLCLITRSDGVIALTLCFFPLLIIITYNKIIVKKRTAYKLCWIILVLIVVFILIICRDWVTKVVDKLLNSFSSDTGRTELYLEAIKNFLKNPIFGYGYDYSDRSTTPTAWNLHSTIFHSLATTGLFGFVAIMVYVVARLKLLMSKGTTFNLYFLIAFLAFQCYAFVDTCEYNPVPLSAALLVMLLVVEKYNETENLLEKGDPLPLLYKRESLYVSKIKFN